MKIIRKIIIVVIFFPLFTQVAHSEIFSGIDTEKTQLALSGLKIGMSREETVDLLGCATWAVIRGDGGALTLPDPAIGLELYWKNRPCSPIVIEFDYKGKVTGWDAGKGFCDGTAHMLEPSEEYSCSKEDRKKICGNYSPTTSMKINAEKIQQGKYYMQPAFLVTRDQIKVNIKTNFPNNTRIFTSARREIRQSGESESRFPEAAVSSAPNGISIVNNGEIKITLNKLDLSNPVEQIIYGGTSWIDRKFIKVSFTVSDKGDQPKAINWGGADKFVINSFSFKYKVPFSY